MGLLNTEIPELEISRSPKWLGRVQVMEWDFWTALSAVRRSESQEVDVTGFFKRTASHKVMDWDFRRSTPAAQVAKSITPFEMQAVILRLKSFLQYVAAHLIDEPNHSQIKVTKMGLTGSRCMACRPCCKSIRTRRRRRFSPKKWRDTEVVFCCETASFSSMQPADLSANSPMGVILETLPGAKRAIFARYHLGGCQSCAFSNEETLAELCARSEIPMDEVLAHLLASHVHDSAMWMEPAVAKDEISNLRLIDLRTREEHEAVVIPGSEFFTQELQQQLFTGDSNTRILLYDHCGRNVLDQVAWFRGHGLHETYGLLGGIDAWSREIDKSIPRYRVEMD